MGEACKNRDVSTFSFFEMYWAMGMSSREIAGVVDHNRGSIRNTIRSREIPLRSVEDARELACGKVQVTELWDDYLTEFQISLAQELRTMYLNDLDPGERDDENET